MSAHVLCHVQWHQLPSGQGGRRDVVHVEGGRHVGHRDTRPGIGRPQHLVEPGDDIEALCGKRFPGCPVAVRHQVWVVVAHADHVHLGPGRRAQRRHDPGELRADISQGEVDAGFVDLVVPEALHHVVEADVDGHQNGRRMLVQERHGQADLRRERVAAVSAVEHGQSGLAGTAQLHQLEVTPAGTLRAQEVVGVPLVGRRSVRDGRRGLKAHRVRSTDGEVVVRSRHCGLRSGMYCRLTRRLHCRPNDRRPNDRRPNDRRPNDCRLRGAR